MHHLPDIKSRTAALHHLSLALFTTAALFALFAILTSSHVFAGSDTANEVVEVLSFVDDYCYVLIDEPYDVNHYVTKDVYLSLPYSGTITEATLLLRSSNVPTWYQHPIFINGMDTGHIVRADAHNLGTCKTDSPDDIVEYDLSPDLLHPGTNIVRLTTAPTKDTWGANYVALRVRGEGLQHSTFVSTQFPGEGGQGVDAVILEPSEQTSPRPLLLLFHGWNGKPLDPFVTEYTAAAVERQWLVASPQQRGHNTLGSGGQPLASLRSQHDAAKLIEYMQTNYSVDMDRIYVGGFSMGGMMAGVMAEKYPDVFAAAVTHKAITDLSDWFYEEGEFRQSQIITETGGEPWEIPFEYARRSPVDMASNLKNLPLAIVHGDVDTVAEPHHATDFHDAVNAIAPEHVEIQWYEGGHADDTLPFGGEWAASFMESYTRQTNPRQVRIRTDEAKSFYWLDIGKRPSQFFTDVDVDVELENELITVSSDDVLILDLVFDIGAMGLDTNVSYVVSQTHESQGTRPPYPVTLIDNKLNVTLPKGRSVMRLFPNRGNMPVTHTFLNGLNYEGTTDTYLDVWAVDTANGQKVTLNLRPDDVNKSLLRFDLKNILPDNVEIKAADLKLYDTNVGPDMSVGVHRMLRPWNELTATYNQADTGQPWGAPGGAPGLDWESEPIRTLSLQSNEGVGYRSINLLSTVQDWLQHPDSNHGLALVVSTSSYNSTRQLQSADHWHVNVRPRLDIIYQPIPPTATPSPTPTSTPTPTITPTPTPSVGLVTGVVYEDVNGDGSHQVGEPTLVGAIVHLLQGTERLFEQTTAEDGAYSFTYLELGQYTVQEFAPSGYHPAHPTDKIIVNIDAGDRRLIDFGHEAIPTSTPTATPYHLYLPMSLK
ncbi:MAG: alpha/beta fold hydrolase [Chloroflexi bacterium]|nr:alpha/beta fold hydrolase [Chloroflexota bacterium]